MALGGVLAMTDRRYRIAARESRAGEGQATSTVPAA
jgi:hypothetical protein